MTARLMAGPLSSRHGMTNAGNSTSEEARDYLDEEATNDEIDEEIQNELEAGND